MVPVPALGPHQLDPPKRIASRRYAKQVAGQLDRCDQIDFDEPLDRLDRHGRQRSGIAESGVVHQDIDASESIQSVGGESLAVHGYGQVRDQGSPAHLVDHLLCAFRVSAMHQHLGASCGEAGRGGVADSGRSTCDQHDGVGQSHGNHDLRRVWG